MDFLVDLTGGVCPQSRLLDGQTKCLLKASCRYCLLRCHLRKLHVHGLTEGLDDVPSLGRVEELIRQRRGCSSRSGRRRRGSRGPCPESRAKTTLKTCHHSLESVRTLPGDIVVLAGVRACRRCRSCRVPPDPFKDGSTVLALGDAEVLIAARARGAEVRASSWSWLPSRGGRGGRWCRRRRWHGAPCRRLWVIVARTWWCQWFARLWWRLLCPKPR